MPQKFVFAAKSFPERNHNYFYWDKVENEAWASRFFCVDNGKRVDGFTSQTLEKKNYPGARTLQFFPPESGLPLPESG